MAGDRIRRYLRLPPSQRRIRDDVAEELAFDIEMRVRALVAGGVDHEQARERAVAEFGDLEATRRYCEEVDMQAETAARRSNYTTDLRSDLLIAWRAMRRAPGFALVVLTTLALGIGANTTVFSVIRRVLIAPLPYRAPQQLFRLYTPLGDGDKLSAVELTALAEESHALAGVTMFGFYGGYTYTDGQVAEPWQGTQVAPNFFDVLGVHPMLGRPFTGDDLLPGAPPVVLIGFPLWQRVFGGDERVVGRHIQLNNADFAVIGVLPENFVGPTFVADALFPMNVPNILRTSGMSRARMLRSVVRLRDGVSVDALRAELAVVRPRIQARYPEIKDAGDIRPVALHDAVVGGAGPVLWLVMAGALLVLVVACVNIAGLFLSRAVAQRRELGVRAALGAGRTRLVRQVLTESSLYGLVGGGLGITLAFVMKGAFLRLAGNTLPKLGEVRVDAGVLAFATLVAIACGLAVGLVPAISATRVDLRDALGESSGRGASQGRAGGRLTQGLVASQMAFAILLVVGAGLLLRTFLSLTGVQVGYSTGRDVLTFRVNLQAARYRSADQRRALFAALTDRVRALPGVKAAGFTAVSPWNGGIMGVDLHIAGRPADASGGTPPNAEYATASDGYFSALGVPLRSGRVFQATDRAGSPPVIVISESVARRYWPSANPIGSRLTLDTGSPTDSSKLWEVIGVVGDVRPSALADIVPTIYVAENQVPSGGAEFTVRTAGDASQLAPAIKQALHDLDARLPLINARTMRDVLGESIARQELAMALMGAFAILALVLAALGVYSVMAYAVVARTREFGIRTALGARKRTIVALVMRRGLATTLIGVVCGLVLAAVLARLIASLLVGVSAHDTMTFVVAPLVLIFVASVACLVPARAATRVEPVDALRVE